MTETIRSGAWFAITESIKGASHTATGKENQDAVSVLTCSELSGLAVAVADGHGSNKYIRSEEGARIAVDIATKEFALLLDRDDQRYVSTDELEQHVAQVIVQKWRNAVNEDLKTRPLEDDDRRLSGLSPGNDHLAYGTTLLAAGVKCRASSTSQKGASEGVAYFVQIGDGDLVVVDISGKVSRPIATERGALGEETDSLCMKDAWKKFRGAARRINRDNFDEQPSLIFMTTDGYPKAFVDDEAFLQAAKDYFDLLSKPEGALAVERNLSHWLREASDKFTGDDVTVALVSRVIKAPKTRTKAQKPSGQAKTNTRAGKG